MIIEDQSIDIQNIVIIKLYYNNNDYEISSNCI